jgi:Ca-activated chloride channel family protein
MRFEQPWLLLLAPAAVLLGWIAYRMNEPRRAALSFPDSRKLAGASDFRARLYRIFPYGVKSAALLLCVLALARPQSVLRGDDGSSQGIDIMLVLDTSTSMRAIDFDPLDRIGAAKETAKRFIAGRVHDRIGILVFGGAPVMTCPLTTDYGALLDFLNGVQAGMTDTDGTAIGDAIAAAADHFRSSKAKSKVMVMLTDGANNAGIIDPLTAAKLAASFGIKIYTVGCAKRGQSLVPVDTQFGRQLVRIPDELNEESLTEIAQATGGEYFRATNYQELSSIYGRIDKLQKSDVASPPVLSFTDRYRWVLAPAVLMLIAAMALSQTLMLRIP